MKFDLSRIEFSKFDIKRDLKLPIMLDEKLAEDLGIMVGDGHIGKEIRKKRAVEYQIMCFGNAVTDRVFYRHYVRTLKKEIFNLDFAFSNQRRNTCVIKINSKGLLQFYTGIIGLPVGRKDNIKVPNLIMESKNKIKCSFIRGLGDSDFSLAFREKHTKRLYYPSIKIKTMSKNLIEDLDYLLKDLGFKITMSYNLKSKLEKTNKLYTGHELWLNGEDNLKRWIRLVGFSNPKNTLKYNLWRRYGFCPRDGEIRRLMESGPRGIRTPNLQTQSF